MSSEIHNHREVPTCKDHGTKDWHPCPLRHGGKMKPSPRATPETLLVFSMVLRCRYVYTVGPSWKVFWNNKLSRCVRHDTAKSPRLSSVSWSRNWRNHMIHSTLDSRHHVVWPSTHESWLQKSHCCQFYDFVARLSDFSPFRSHLATSDKSSDFGHLRFRCWAAAK